MSYLNELIRDVYGNIEMDQETMRSWTFEEYRRVVEYLEDILNYREEIK